MKKIEKVVILVLIIISLIVFFLTSFLFKNKMMVSVLDADNQIILRFNIYDDNVYELDGNYGKFYLEVKDGKCRAINVDCPNHYCEHVGWISSKNPVPIICLPNGFVVMIDE